MFFALPSSQSAKLSFVAAVIASLILSPIARAAARRLGVVDRPDGGRKQHDRPVPLWGGIAVYLALVAGLLMARFGGDSLAAFDQLSTTIILASGLVCLVGCLDDSRNLNGRVKLLLQIVSVVPVVVAGYYVDRIVAFGYPIELGYLGIPLTVLWLVGCINALNLLDGLDGLASVVGISASLMMAIIATNAGHPHVAVVALVLAGSLAGFLIYNLPPASIFLGDSGSMVIGLVVGMISIQGALKTSATLSITVPAVVMSVPMLDTVFAIVRRKLSGQRFDTADRGHIHHRLLERGLTNWQALCIIGALCLTTGAAATAATLLRFESLGWITALVLIVLLVRTRAFGHHEIALAKEKLSEAFAAVLVALTRAWRRFSMRRGGTWDGAWRVFVRHVAARGIGGFELLLADRAGQSRYSWRHPVPAVHGSAQAPLVLSFTGADGTFWQLHLLAIPSDEERTAVPALLPLLDEVIQSWRGTNDTLPPADLAVSYYYTAAALRLPAA